MSSVGAAASSVGGNTGRIFIRLKPRAERTLSADAGHPGAAAASSRQIPGIRVFLQNPPPIRIGGQLTKSQYQYTLQGPDTDELYTRGARCSRRSCASSRACRTSPATCRSRTRR